ncbi:hypothetical protein QFZ97_001161 [Paraburkholderia youngii]
MMAANRSLRVLVEKWLWSCSEAKVRFVRLDGRRSSRRVRVEARRAEGPVILFFFQHNDGAWRVFPPAPYRVCMAA